jgi:hypothetical protein
MCKFCSATDGWQHAAMAIHNRHDFHAFSALCGSDIRAAAFGHYERRVDEAFFFIKRAAVAKLVGNIRQHATQNLVAAPRLKAPMHRFVVRIALRQHVPLRAGVDNPQHCLKHAPRRHWFASRTVVGNMLFWKMFPDAFPLLVAEPNHLTFLAVRDQLPILR